MASASVSNRLIAAGISGGAGIVLPVAVYAATLSMGSVNDAVREGAAPFGVGALVGVGLYAVTAGLMERSAADADIEGFRDEEAQHQVQDEVSAFSPEETGVFFRKRSRRRGDVPVISRAEGAPSEEEAWREIDSLFAGDSPVSCDAEKSKDLYEIALEQAAVQGAAGQAASAAHFGGAAVGHAAQPQTAQPVAPSTAHAAAHFAAQPVSVAPQAAQPAYQAMSVQADDRAARWAAALDILGERDDGAMGSSGVVEVERPRGAHFAIKDDGVSASAQQVPDASSVFGSQQVIASQALGHREVSAPQTVEPQADHAASSHQQQVIDPFVHVPTDFIQEVTASAPSAMQDVAASAAPAIRGASSDVSPSHMVNTLNGNGISQSGATASLSFEDELRRARAIREGRRETAIHGRVNEILNEELDRIRSRSMKRSVHDFLRVVDGGTSPLPRLGVREA